MRLSLVFELLLIFVLLAFAASRVIDSEGFRNHESLMRKSGKVGHKTRQDVNKYCSCSTKLCNCCREFNIPVVSLKGPGCATLQYLQGDKLAISMSFGERVLTNTTISGRKPRPVCMLLPGGVSQFCGRVYNIAREGEDFKACLGLELRALQDIEASLRVSCFRFGPKGLKVEPAQQLPVVPNEGNKDDEDEDDEDDDDDDDDDEYDFDDEYDLDNDVDTADYTGFGVFDDDFVGDLFGVSEETDKVKVKKPKPVKKITVSTTKPPVKINTNKPNKVVTKPQNKVTTAKPPTKVTTRVTQANSTTLQPVKFEKLPEIVMISTNAPSVSLQEEKIPSTSHVSIAAVTAMLQEAPVPVAQIEPIKMAPSTATPTEKLTEKASEVVTMVSPHSTIVIEETTYATTTASADDEEESSTEVVENLILRNDEDHDDDDDDEDDDDDDPISSAIEDVLGDDDQPKKDNTTKIMKEKIDKTKMTKEETDVMDDIVDGVMETLTGESSNKKLPDKNVKHVKGFEYDDNEDDDEYDDDDDGEDDDARKIKNLKT